MLKLTINFGIDCKNWEKEKRKGEFLKENCDWITLEVTGVWEKQICRVKNILTALLYHHGRQLDGETFRTFVIEAEIIGNRRPLAVDNNSSPHSLEPVIPNHSLTTNHYQRLCYRYLERSSPLASVQEKCGEGFIIFPMNFGIGGKDNILNCSYLGASGLQLSKMLR